MKLEKKLIYKIRLIYLIYGKGTVKRKIKS